jgi:GNAT superfamily N-acetyltransferase
MAVEIRRVETKRDLKKFIRFNYELYKNNPYSVPDLYEDARDTFSKEKNPAFEFCDAECFLAYKDGKLAGRVAGIINRRANETWNTSTVRFGWIDFIDDREVSAALLDTVAQWGREHGMTDIEGPLGFTDIDAEGMLIEGFDQLSTMATIYNYPYYPEHMEALGFAKKTDWIEKKLFVPKQVPDGYQRIADIVMKRCNLHIHKIKSRKEILKTDLPYRIFDLINEAYSPLFGYSRMSRRQVDQYVKSYFPFLDMRMVTIVEDADNQIVAVGISMPSLARALQKAHGKLFPFGWFHLAKALFFKRSEILDLLLVGVKPEYQSKGVNALLFADLIPAYIEMGFSYGETNPELEENEKVQSQWKYLDCETHKRRRCFHKPL